MTTNKTLRSGLRRQSDPASEEALLGVAQARGWQLSMQGQSILDSTNERLIMTAKTILLVEDDDNDVFFFKMAMTKAGAGFPLQVATDGQQAIDYLRGAGKFANREAFPLPGLILLDLKLPLVMGLDVLKCIRQQRGLAPIVVILSSSEEESDVAAAYQLGANAYLVKPAEPSKLVDLVRSLSSFWLVQNTPPPSTTASREPETLTHRRPDELLGEPCWWVNGTSVHANAESPRSDL
jgi:two-component system response regulator